MNQHHFQKSRLFLSNSSSKEFPCELVYRKKPFLVQAKYTPSFFRKLPLSLAKQWFSIKKTRFPLYATLFGTLLVASVLTSCQKYQTKEKRLESFYTALKEVEIKNPSENSGYLIDSFERGDLGRVARDLDYYCYGVGANEDTSGSQLDPRESCPKLLEVKSKESIDFFSSSDTATYYHRYFYQKIVKEKSPQAN